jgi:hypothetical protein
MVVGNAEQIHLNENFGIGEPGHRRGKEITLNWFAKNTCNLGQTSWGPILKWEIGETNPKRDHGHVSSCKIKKLWHRF